jgi:hypothetical protein
VAESPTPPATAEDGIHRLLYVCVARKPFSREELTELLAKSRANNMRDSVTGLLLYKEGVFTQLLEGNEEAVRQCFARICQDPRHGGCTLIDSGSAAARMFPDWRMGFRNLSETDVSKLPGYSDFMISGASKPNAGEAVHYWRLLESFRQEM